MGHRPPDALLSIRFRECGVLRWLIAEGFVKLDQKASAQMTTSEARKMKYLGGQRIPLTLRTGTFLAFACVEFDSLQELEWLVKDRDVDLDEEVNGFNLLHACAFFGRLEIILWYRRPQWARLSSALSTRKQGYEGFSALHIAVERGFTNTANLLLLLEYSPRLGKGLPVEALASRSRYAHVRQWAEERSHHVSLCRDVEKLQRLLRKGTEGDERIKEFVSSSQCFSVQRWNDSDVQDRQTALPNGQTYESVLSSCIDGRGKDFALWLAHKIKHQCDYATDHDTELGRFWFGFFKYIEQSQSKLLHLPRLQAYMRDWKELVMEGWLDLQLASDIAIADPRNKNPILATKMLQEDYSEQFWKECIMADVCYALLAAVRRRTERCLSSGSSTETIQGLFCLYRKVAEKCIVAERNTHGLNALFRKFDLFVLDDERWINIENYVQDTEYTENSPIWYHWPIRMRAITPLYQFVTIENYSHFMSLLHNHGKGWSSAKQMEVVRISAFLGNHSIVDFFLKAAAAGGGASIGEIAQAALLGAAEGGREEDWRRLLDFAETREILSPDFLSDFAMEDKPNIPKNDENVQNPLLSSLPAMIMHGYFSVGLRYKENQEEHLQPFRSMIRTLVKDYDHEAVSLFNAARLVLERSFDVEMWEGMEGLLDFLWTFGITKGDKRFKKVLDPFNDSLARKSQDEYVKLKKRWLTYIEHKGIDIQNCKPGLGRDEAVIRSHLSSLKAKQRERWTQFEIVKNDSSLSEIQIAVESGRLDMQRTDRAGLGLIHLAAAYDRIDVIQWLVEEKGIGLDHMDSEGRDVLSVAKASTALASSSWIEERLARMTLSAFFKKYSRRRLATARKQRYFNAITKLQAQHRGRLARKTYRSLILLRVKGRQRFVLLWLTVFEKLENGKTAYPTWALLKSLHEMRPSEVDDIDEIIETKEALEVATSIALQDGHTHMDLDDDTADGSTVVDTSSHEHLSTSNQAPQTNAVDAVSRSITLYLSNDVVKWLRRSDGRYRSFFVRRMEQLKRGDRSRILAKSLKGSKSTIYETYLEQKSGHRILWQEEDHNSIFVWYVAKHKSVSRLMKLIDDCENRSTRQRVSVSTLHEIDDVPETTESRASVRLNPLGNVPLKVYSIRSNDLHEIMKDSWTPQLYLSREERDIVETPGTVLLLGRSGTGKTVCICNRMDRDRQRYESTLSFSQLFVARSQRLCRYVGETLGEGDGSSSFLVFDKMVQYLENELPKVEGVRDLFLPTQKMDFARFKRDVLSGESRKSGERIDPLVVWTSIRTFLKGSVEAFSTSTSMMDKNAFMSLGRKRCRLPAKEREVVFEVYERYQTGMTAQGSWDDCDRIVALLKRLQFALQWNHACMEKVRRSKIYVDEIQDYTQCEILVFFWLSGPGDLFLAGDPAQSVAEGVDFRFEEIRSVGYFVAGSDRREWIPQKPKKVTVNFRSHSGVLDTAAVILRVMFTAYPDSAKQLGEDRGMFSGPRPGVFHHIPVDVLKTLIWEKLNVVVILTQDSSVSHWKRVLGEYQLVYGIRAAKGLEFKSVIILDFFVGLPRDVQKPWRNLLLGRDESLPSELEVQLKLLYTGVTRCIEQLFFAETRRSIAGDAFARWLTTKSIRDSVLATRQNINNVETMAMSQDEWKATGLDNAEMAESHAEGSEKNLGEGASLLDKAVFCFEQGKDLPLARKARTYRSSLLYHLSLQEETSTGRSAPSSSPLGSDVVVEVRSAELFEQLCSEGLLLEGYRLLQGTIPFVDDYTRESLEKGPLAELSIWLTEEHGILLV